VEAEEAEEVASAVVVAAGAATGVDVGIRKSVK